VLHEPVGVRDDLALQLSFHVRGVHVLADLPSQVAVAHDPLDYPRVQQLHELPVQTRLRQREEGVHEHPSRRCQVHLHVSVDAPLLLEGQHLGAVARATDEPEPIRLDHVAQLLVHHQTPREQGRVEPEPGHGPALRFQAPARVLVGSTLPLVHVVVNQRVVHVESHGADALHVQRPVAEDLSGRGREVGEAIHADRVEEPTPRGNGGLQDAECAGRACRWTSPRGLGHDAGGSLPRDPFIAQVWFRTAKETPC